MIDLLIPVHVPSQNERERWHWAVQRREVQMWAAQFRREMRPGTMDRATGKRLVRIVAYRTRRITDHANLVGGCKGLVDGLVKAGLLVDDAEKWCDISYSQDLASKSPTGGVCTSIQIEDAP